LQYNSSHADKSQPYGLLILCEVALGNMYLKRQAEMISKLPAQYLSTKGEGQMEPDQSQNVILSDGVIVPCGKIIKTGLSSAQTSLLYPEFIVYSIDQLVIKYMVKVKFHFK
jgi:poly [ADP-ribose] polymerase